MSNKTCVIEDKSANSTEVRRQIYMKKQDIYVKMCYNKNL